MSRKAKLAGLFAASQTEAAAKSAGTSDDFGEASGVVDVLGSIVRDLLASCKRSEFDEDTFRTGLAGVKACLSKSVHKFALAVIHVSCSHWVFVLVVLNLDLGLSSNSPTLITELIR